MNQLDFVLTFFQKCGLNLIRFVDLTFLCPYEFVYVTNNLSRVVRASTTAHRQRSLFPEGVLLGSLDPNIEICRSADLNFRHKKTAMLSGADSRYEFVVRLSYSEAGRFVNKKAS